MSAASNRGGTLDIRTRYVVSAEADEAGRVYVRTNTGEVLPTGIIAPSFRCRSDITVEEWQAYMQARLRDNP